MKWVEELPRAHGGRRHTDHDAILKELNTRRGKWAVIFEYERNQDSRAGAQVIAFRRQYGELYEFAQRRVGDKQLVFGRRKPVGG